jgi:hypothetical protein
LRSRDTNEARTELTAGVRGSAPRIAPDGGDAWAPAKPRLDHTLIRALARAHRWKRMLEEGRYRSGAEIAEAEGVTRSFVNRLLRLTLLAPDIVEAILDGWQPKGMVLEELTRAMPSGWEEQRQVTCRPQSSNEKPSERRKRRGGFAPRSAAAVLSATP